MKPLVPIVFKILILTLVFLFPSRKPAQLSINLSSVTCNSLTASANTGTLTVNTLSWSILPVGPIIYSSTTQSTIIRFPQSGNYFISLIAQTSQGNAQTSQSLSVIAVPSITINASPDTVCWTQSSTLSAGGGLNYTWTPSSFLSSIGNSVTVSTLSSSLTYTLISNNGMGCTNTNTVHVTFVLNPNPIIVPTSSNICIGSTATLTAFSASYYSWSGTTFTGAVANQSLIAGPGTYTVVGSNGDACKAESTISIIGIPCPNGVFELNTNFSPVLLYPNPTSGAFFISSDYSILKRIVIADVFGRIILNDDKILQINEPLEVGFSNFPNGIYLVKIDLDDGSSRALRVIKE